MANKTVFDKVTARRQSVDTKPEHSDNVEKKIKSKREQKLITINEEDPDRSQTNRKNPQNYNNRMEKTRKSKRKQSSGKNLTVEGE